MKPPRLGFVYFGTIPFEQHTPVSTEHSRGFALLYQERAVGTGEGLTLTGSDLGVSVFTDRLPSLPFAVSPPGKNEQICPIVKSRPIKTNKGS